MARSIKINSNFGPSNDPLIKRLVSRNFLEVLNTAQEGEYDLNNMERAANYLMIDLADFMAQDILSPWFGKFTSNEYMELLKNYGMNGEYLLNYVMNEIFPMATKKFQKIFIIPTKKVESRISDKIRKRYEEQVNNYRNSGGELKEVSYFEAEKLMNDDRYDVYAVRDKNGEHECLFYAITKGGDRHWVRSLHGYNVYCNYFNVREMLFKNWNILPEDKKYATAA